MTGAFSPEWLFQYTVEKWAPFLPAHATETFRRAGNYRVRLSDNIVLLNLNSNYCLRLNMWTYYDSVDPGEQLVWLRDQLYQAELHGDRAHIVMHVPPDNVECTQPWSYNYLRIVERFKDTIAGQYSGHTHRDEFRVFYSTADDTLPVGVQFVAPSITSYSNTNPSYRTYTINNRGQLLNYETYYANASAAQANGGVPSWQKAYDAQQYYRSDTHAFDLSGHAYHTILEALRSDVDIFARYHRVHTTHSDHDNVKNCDSDCREAILFAHKVANPYNQEIPFPSTL